jgi:PAS domain S-box-containing protein
MDLIAVFGSLSALLFILLGTRRSPWKPEITLFAFIILLTIGHDVGNFLEWTGVTNWFDPVEDYLEVLTAALWAFFLYTFLQEMTERDLRQVQELDEKILESSPVAFVLRDADLRIVRLSRAFGDVTGFDPEAAMGKTLEEFMPDYPGRQALAERLQNVLDTGQTSGPLDMEAPTQVSRHLRETILPISDPEGRVVNTLSVLEDITSQVQTERKLRELQELDEKILDGSPVAFVLHDLDMRIIRVSSAYRKVTGFKSEEVLGLTLEKFMPQGPQKDGIIQRIRYVREQRTQVGPQDIESPIPGRYLRETILPIFNAERKVVNTLSVLEDVTDVKLAVKALKQSEEKLRSSLIEKETLLREVHHRVKNNLQVISGLLNLQSRYIADEAVKSIYKESQNRIKTMALIHEELYQGTDLARINLAEYIMGLAENLTSSYSITRDRVRLVLDLEDEDMALDTAIPCGLMVNELMSNSLKHAFPGESEGEISIALHRLDGEKYSLSVSDNGIGLPRGLDYRKTGTMGMQLVVVLAEQLGADLEYDGETGTSFTITFSEYHEASPDVV